MAAAQLSNVTALRGEFRVAKEVDEVHRPYRIWNSKEKCEVRWANFKNLRHAHMRALCEAAWSKGDSVFEVFDLRNGGLRGQYQRYGTEIKFWRSHHDVDGE